MAARIVDVFELIEIHEAQRASFPLLVMLSDLGIEFGDESMTSVKAGQRIVIGQVREMLLPLLQRKQRVAESGHDSLSLLMPWHRKRYIHLSCCDFRERP